MVAAIILWNAVYFERADARAFDPSWLPHLAPVHWDHINRTGDHSWRENKRVERGGFWSFRPARLA